MPYLAAAGVVAGAGAAVVVGNVTGGVVVVVGWVPSNHIFDGLLKSFYWVFYHI